MIRVYAVVEGQTERALVKDVLAPHLASLEVYLSPIVVQTSPGYRGGGSSWKKWENDIRTTLKQKPGVDVRVTTLFDLFRLPGDFPEFKQISRECDTKRRCDNLEAAMTGVFDDPRFIPYIQRHEVEALVLASLDSLPELFDDEQALKGISELKRELGEQHPEDVNDGPETAPSKRLQKHLIGYRKVLHGPDAVKFTKLAVVRRRCPRFDKWMEGLEALSPEATE